MVWGVPLGQLECVLARVAEKGVVHDRMLEKILLVQGLLLLFRAGARASKFPVEDSRTTELTQKFCLTP